MGPITSYTGSQQGLTPLNKQLNAQKETNLGQTGGDSSGGRAVSSKEVTPKVASSNGSESRNLQLRSSNSSDEKPQNSSRRGSLVDVLV